MNNLQVEHMKQIRQKLTRFMMMYKFALHEVETKIKILREEFHFLHEYNPIEHTKSRLKSPESIANKLIRKGGPLTLSHIRDCVKDIAGIRITCSFLSDIYRISDMLQRQDDLKVVSVKDYIQHPKPNGYKSLHLLVEVPVYMSDRLEHVEVEIQIRTIAMDFWASLEHKIFYKYNGSVPEELLDELKEAADTASDLDKRMERLHRDIAAIKLANRENDDQSVKLLTEGEPLNIPEQWTSILKEETD